MRLGARSELRDESVQAQPLPRGPWQRTVASAVKHAATVFAPLNQGVPWIPLELMPTLDWFRSGSCSRRRCSDHSQRTRASVCTITSSGISQATPAGERERDGDGAVHEPVQQRPCPPCSLRVAERALAGALLVSDLGDVPQRLRHSGRLERHGANSFLVYGSIVRNSPARACFSLRARLLGFAVRQAPERVLRTT